MLEVKSFSFYDGFSLIIKLGERARAYFMRFKGIKSVGRVFMGFGIVRTVSGMKGFKICVVIVFWFDPDL